LIPSQNIIPPIGMVRVPIQPEIQAAGAEFYARWMGDAVAAGRDMTNFVSACALRLDGLLGLAEVRPGLKHRAQPAL
jgi:hypothetical protein